MNPVYLVLLHLGISSKEISDTRWAAEAKCTVTENACGTACSRLT